MWFAHNCRVSCCKIVNYHVIVNYNYMVILKLGENSGGPQSDDSSSWEEHKCVCKISSSSL